MRARGFREPDSYPIDSKVFFWTSSDLPDLVKSKIAELGENIVIRRFTRYLMGEPLSGEAPSSASA